MLKALLPLGNVDSCLHAPAKPFDIRRVAQDAKLAEGPGFDGMVCEVN
jgi:hypothetical protein